MYMYLCFIHKKSKFFSAPKNQLSPSWGDIAPIENKQIVRCIELEGDLSTAGNTKDFCIPCSNPSKRGGEEAGASGKNTCWVQAQFGSRWSLWQDAEPGGQGFQKVATSGAMRQWLAVGLPGAGEAEEHGTRASERAMGPASRDGPARMLRRRPTHQTTSRKETDVRQRCWEEQGGGSDVLGAWGRSHVWRTDLEPEVRVQSGLVPPGRLFLACSLSPCPHTAFPL